MKERVELTEHEKWTLLNKGNLVSIPKKKRYRIPFPPNDIKRIEYISYPSRIYLRNEDKWYEINEKEIPKYLLKHFLDGK